MRRAPSQNCHSRALLLLGLLAVVRAAWPSSAYLPPERAGPAVSIRLETLAGPAFRLLPGVGPVLAERLEQARSETAGPFDERAAGEVRGIGPALLARWAELRSR